ncbi:hypothetical protein SERV_ORF89 [short-finned eel virus]|uniref:Uncharacterized protein n=1 Tax=short-finned eel virus TaxID=2848076 RepID=A0A192GR31_FRG3V|nr:hypothetical protein SERV_ORF89 [Short-finned eel ranavirus]ANK58059.1 hypothetical protein SERV_ORF89 [Short-finned eel ranavirus]
MTFFVNVTLPGVVCRMHGELNLSFEQLCEVAFLIEDRRRPSNVTVKVVTVKGLSGSPDSVLVYSNGKYFCRDSDGSDTLVMLRSVDNVDLPVVKFVVVPAVGATQQAETAPAAPAPAVSVPAVGATQQAETAPAAPAPAAPAPAVSVPAVSVPAVSVPAVSVPAVSVPAVSVPAVSVPAVSVPAVSVPAPAVAAKAPAFTGFAPFKPTSVFPSFGKASAAAPAAQPSFPSFGPSVFQPFGNANAPASLFGPAQPSTSSMFAPSSSLFVPAAAPAPSTSGFTIPTNLRSDAYVCPFATAGKERKERDRQQPAPRGLNHDLAAQEHLHPSLVSRFPSNFRGSFLG